jgi:hypothetical protein
VPCCGRQSAICPIRRSGPSQRCCALGRSPSSSSRHERRRTPARPGRSGTSGGARRPSAVLEVLGCQAQVLSGSYHAIQACQEIADPGCRRPGPDPVWRRIHGVRGVATKRARCSSSSPGIGAASSPSLALPQVPRADDAARTGPDPRRSLFLATWSRGGSQPSRPKMTSHSDRRVDRGPGERLATKARLKRARRPPRASSRRPHQPAALPCRCAPRAGRCRRVRSARRQRSGGRWAATGLAR